MEKRNVAKWVTRTKAIKRAKLWGAGGSTKHTMALSGPMPVPSVVCALKSCICAQVQGCKGFSRADSQHGIGHFLPRCSPDASSALDANPRPEFIILNSYNNYYMNKYKLNYKYKFKFIFIILKHYIFILMGVRLRAPFYTWFVGWETREVLEVI